MPLHRAYSGCCYNFKYDIVLTYKHGRNVHLADTLSWAPRAGPSSPDVDFIVMTVSFIPSSCVEDLVAQTAADSTLRSLTSVIKRGWPDKHYNVLLPVRPFFTLRGELVLQDGIIIKGHKTVVPALLHSKYFNAVHAGHQALKSPSYRQETFFTGMAEYISKNVASCEVCNSLAQHQQKQPLLSHPAPALP